MTKLAKPNPKHHASIINNQDYEMTHSRAGNGWAVIQDVGDEMVRCSAIGADKLGDNYLLWSRMLTPGNKIAPDMLEKVNQLRSDIKNGIKIFISPRVVSASM